jgi:uncharacterized protein YqjF (DUF2071 family)
MPKTFLSAEWRNLIMANYRVDPALLQTYLPCHTELDVFNNEHYISLVAFLFKNVKLRGIAFPFHTCFEEVNLRFYVRYKENNIWKRGVVFMKEIVPKRMVSFIANTIYGENYATHSMKHDWKETKDELNINYRWKVKHEWNYINCIAEREPAPIVGDSFEAFITEHYRGYTFINKHCTGMYEVAHPEWRIHKVKTYNIRCDAKILYGSAFEGALGQLPQSVFLAEGSAVKIMKRVKIQYS